MTSAPETYLPIVELSAYRRKWTIKARVTNKAPLRTFKKGAGEGKLFNVELLDAMGGEIKATFFHQAADKFHDMLEVGKCFTFSQGSVRVADKMYNRTNHRYELTFDTGALVEEASEDASIKTIQFSFVSIGSLKARALPCTVDICGIVSSFNPPMPLTSRDGKELVKRSITVVDDSATSLEVALWGDRATQPDKVFQDNPVVSLKFVAMKEWNGSPAGSLGDRGTLIFNDASEEATRVKQWWTQGGGSSQNVLNLSETKGGGDGKFANRATPCTSLGSMRRLVESVSSQPQHFSVVARLCRVQTRKRDEPQPLYYNACQEKRENGWSCNKRVDESGFCASCNRAGSVAPRLNIRCQFLDFEGQAWLSSFHEAAAKLLDKTGEEVHAMETAAAERGEGGRQALEADIEKKYFQKPMLLTVRAKLDTYMGETRTNCSIIAAKPVSYADHGRQLLKDIHKLLAY